MSDRKRINQHARRMEDKAEDRLKELGFTLVEDTGRRTQNLGDKIMYHKDTGLLLMIDHKSTQNKESFSMKKKALRKIREEGESYGDAVLAALTITFKGDTDVYIAFNLKDLLGVMY